MENNVKKQFKDPKHIGNSHININDCKILNEKLKKQSFDGKKDLKILLLKNIYISIFGMSTISTPIFTQPDQ